MTEIPVELVDNLHRLLHEAPDQEYAVATITWRRSEDGRIQSVSLSTLRDSEELEVTVDDQTEESRP